ncbi:hypothetical protein JYU34_012193 [Plutella xylostella]|uniref:Uncharacterized protein n=1 Tax=Plutella xylostella TaxID=51655 RepID=A0ABQ7QEJ2_PLUXY|nr:hypothetical protein JYU34_012193 [Plutella xylostella]
MDMSKKILEAPDVKPSYASTLSTKKSFVQSMNATVFQRASNLLPEEGRPRSPTPPPKETKDEENSDMSPQDPRLPNDGLVILGSATAWGHEAIVYEKASNLLPEEEEPKPPTPPPKEPVEEKGNASSSK